MPLPENMMPVGGKPFRRFEILGRKIIRGLPNSLKAVIPCEKLGVCYILIAAILALVFVGIN